MRGGKGVVSAGKKGTRDRRGHTPALPCLQESRWLFCTGPEALCSMWVDAGREMHP